MSNQEEIAALKEKIKMKEADLYRAEKEANAWNKGKYQSHSNAKMSRLFVESSRKEISDLYTELSNLEKPEE